MEWRSQNRALLIAGPVRGGIGPALFCRHGGLAMIASPAAVAAFGNGGLLCTVDDF